MTAAEALRNAASLMRERAEAATPGPWEIDSNDCCVGATGGKGEDYWVLGERTGAPVANMRHAASWHPAVALAVADWLDDMAAQVEKWHLTGANRYPYPQRALAVANAYLGGEQR